MLSISENPIRPVSTVKFDNVSKYLHAFLVDLQTETKAIWHEYSLVVFDSWTKVPEDLSIHLYHHRIILPHHLSLNRLEHKSTPLSHTTPTKTSQCPHRHTFPLLRQSLHQMLMGPRAYTLKTLTE